MAKVELKKPVVEEISSKIQGAQSVVLATYSGSPLSRIPLFVKR